MQRFTNLEQRQLFLFFCSEFNFLIHIENVTTPKRSNVLFVKCSCHMEQNNLFST